MPMQVVCAEQAEGGGAAGGGEIQASHQRTRGTYGPNRLQGDLKEHGTGISVYLTRRIREKLGMRCRQVKEVQSNDRLKARLSGSRESSESGVSGTRAESGVWVTDMPYIPTDEGWLYHNRT